MASFQIYCPCKVKKIGPAKITGDLAYLLWGWIINKDDRANCKFWGQIVRIVRDESV